MVWPLARKYGRMIVLHKWTLLVQLIHYTTNYFTFIELQKFEKQSFYIYDWLMTSVI